MARLAGEFSRNLVPPIGENGIHVSVSLGEGMSRAESPISRATSFSHDVNELQAAREAHATQHALETFRRNGTLPTVVRPHDEVRHARMQTDTTAGHKRSPSMLSHQQFIIVSSSVSNIVTPAQVVPPPAPAPALPPQIEEPPNAFPNFDLNESIPGNDDVFSFHPHHDSSCATPQTAPKAAVPRPATTTTTATTINSSPPVIFQPTPRRISSSFRPLPMMAKVEVGFILRYKATFRLLNHFFFV